MPSADSSSIILHHYAPSPFSEKVRAYFGIKNLEWFACEQPAMMPKEDLVALTGGYRRIPVMQIGADIYFDSAFMIEELERRFPEPSAYTGIGPGFGSALSLWCDAWGTDSFFMSVVGLLFGGDADIPAPLLEDRAKLFGTPMNPSTLGAAKPLLQWQLKGHLARLNAQLEGSGGPFLCGAQPNMADASFYFIVWFMHGGKGETAALLKDYPKLLEWFQRVAEIGHGRRQETNAEQAIDIAKAAEPAPIVAANAPSPLDPPIGARVKVKSRDANTPVLEGTLAAAGLSQISVRYESPRAGAVMLHMPRSAGELSAA